MTMPQTVTGIFEQSSQAQEACAYLIANGFASQDIDIIGDSEGNDSDPSQTPQEGGIGERIGDFFGKMFDSGADAGSLSESAGLGTTLTVYTTTESQTQEAIQIHNNFGALDVNDYIQTEARPNAATDTFAVDDEVADEYDAELNEPLDTDLINTDILDADILASNTSGTERMDPEVTDDVADDQLKDSSGVNHKPEDNSKTL
jgi:hypothetical protein